VVAGDQPDKGHSDTGLLDKLRGVGMQRPRVDPELAGGLREWLEDALSGAASLLPERSPAIRVGRPEVGGSETYRSVRGPARAVPGAARVASAPATAVRDELVANLVRPLFRQWVTTRRLGNPMGDALASLSVSGDPEGTLIALERMGANQRKAVADEVSEQASVIAATWPALSAAWYPKTGERITVPLCGGRIVLGGVIDLVIGAQAVTEATVCIVDVDSSPRQGQIRRPREVQTDGAVDFLALLETLRSGAAPCRVARYASATGDLDVKPVDENLLVGALLKTVQTAERICRIQAEAMSAEAQGAR
jgi:hypothetical protein